MYSRRIKRSLSTQGENWRHKSALKLTGWLLAVELVGAVLFLAGGDYVIKRTFTPVSAVAAACVVFVVWTLPNALAFYKARGLFTEPAKEKPGL